MGLTAHLWAVREPAQGNRRLPTIRRASFTFPLSPSRRRLKPFSVRAGAVRAKHPARKSRTSSPGGRHSSLSLPLMLFVAPLLGADHLIGLGDPGLRFAPALAVTWRAFSRV